MTNLTTVVVCLLAGYFLRIGGKLPADSSRALNTFAIYVAFPALVIHHVPTTLASMGLSWKLLIPISMPWLLVIVAFLVFSGLGRIFNMRRSTVGALILTAGFANTSFVGFPILEALLGPESIKIAIIISQAGSFLALSTIGLIIASYFSEHEASTTAIGKRLIQFPPFLTRSYVSYLFSARALSSRSGVIGSSVMRTPTAS